jgi:hypothetical protein
MENKKEISVSIYKIENDNPLMCLVLDRISLKELLLLCYFDEDKIKKLDDDERVINSYGDKIKSNDELIDGDYFILNARKK